MNKKEVPTENLPESTGESDTTLTKLTAEFTITKEELVHNIKMDLEDLLKISNDSATIIKANRILEIVYTL